MKAHSESAIKWLISQTRNSTEFPLITEENTNLGFAYNLLGMKPLGIVICIILIVFDALVIGCITQSTMVTSNWIAFSFHANHHIPEGAWVQNEISDIYKFCFNCFRTSRLYFWFDAAVDQEKSSWKRVHYTREHSHMLSTVIWDAIEVGLSGLPLRNVLWNCAAVPEGFAV